MDALILISNCLRSGMSYPSLLFNSFLVIADRLNICQYWPCYYYYCNYKYFLLNLWLLLLGRIIYTSRITKVSIEEYHEKDVEKSIKCSNTIQSTTEYLLMRVDWMDRGKAVPSRVELATCSLERYSRNLQLKKASELTPFSKTERCFFA